MKDSEKVKLYKNIIKSQNSGSDLNLLLQAIDTYIDKHKFVQVLIQDIDDPPIDNILGFYRALYNPFYILVKAYAEMNQTNKEVPHKITLFIDLYGERLCGLQHAIEVVENSGVPVYDEKEEGFLPQLKGTYNWCGQRLSKPKQKSKNFIDKILGLFK